MLKIKSKIIKTCLVSSVLAATCAFNTVSAYSVQIKPSQSFRETSSNVVARQTVDTHFKGAVSQAKFEMFLRRDGERLSGRYFYLKSGSANSLNLTGTINADGKFALRETDAAGKQTGEFSGVWKDDENESGATLEGEWKKPTAKESQFFTASEQMIFFSGAKKITNNQISESIKAKRLELSAEYPQLSGAANAASFNQLVKTRITNEVARFRKDMSAISQADLKMLPEGANNYIDIGYDVEYADDDLINLNFVRSEFTGGAHPNYNFLTVNYDLKNNRELKLAELFKPGAKYLATISAYATKNLRRRTFPESGENLGLAQDIFADGATAKAENYARWNITKKGLLFIFDPYQVGPYAAGAQYVVVPYAALKSIVKPDGALAKFIK
jgi:hypothetical protein